MERKHYAFDLQHADLGTGTFAGHASVFGIPDDGGDIVMPGAFAKTIQEWGPAGKNRIKVLAQHRLDWLPIGKPVELREDDTGLFFSARISDTTLGRDVLTLLRDGVLTEMSIGFETVKADVEQKSGLRRIREVRLFELSPVMWAMQPAARITEVKAVPRNVSEELADRSAAWSAPTLSDFTDQSWGDLHVSERRRIAGHFAWARTMPPERFGDLKLPHHRPSDGRVVWRGVVAAMAALLGARGGVDLPAGERRAVYHHLAAHYRAFDEEPPEFREDDLAALQAGAEPGAPTRQEPVAAGPSADPSEWVAQSLRELNAEMKAYLYWRRP